MVVVHALVGIGGYIFVTFLVHGINPGLVGAATLSNTRAGFSSKSSTGGSYCTYPCFSEYSTVSIS